MFITAVEWAKETAADSTKCGRRLANSGNSRSGANPIAGSRLARPCRLEQNCCSLPSCSSPPLGCIAVLQCMFPPRATHCSPRNVSYTCRTRFQHQSPFRGTRNPVPALTKPQEVLRGGRLDARCAIGEVACRGKKRGQAEEAMLDELQGGPHHAPDIRGEAGGVDEVHPRAAGQAGGLCT